MNNPGHPRLRFSSPVEADTILSVIVQALSL